MRALLLQLHGFGKRREAWFHHKRFVALPCRGPNLDADDDAGEDRMNGNGGAEGGGGAKPRTAQQRAGATLLRHMLDIVEGESYSFRSELIRSAAVRLGFGWFLPWYGYLKLDGLLWTVSLL